MADENNSPSESDYSLSDDDIATYIEAGKIAAAALSHGKTLIKSGELVRDVLDRVEEHIASQGAGLAFPAQSSLNKVAAHFCPGLDDETRYKEGDLVKLDVGVEINGLIADTALSVSLGGPDHERNLRLIEASRKALDAALALAKPGTPLWKIGDAIETTIKGFGFQPIRNLSGHGLGEYEIHAAPTIPNFNNHDMHVLEEGMAIAIEPFASTGVGLISAEQDAEIFNLETKHPVRSPFARDVLKQVEPLNGLPFCLRHLSRKLGAGKTRFGVSELLRQDILVGHGPLVERSGGIVAQSEHSVLILEKPIVFTRIDQD